MTKYLILDQHDYLVDTFKDYDQALMAVDNLMEINPNAEYDIVEYCVEEEQGVEDLENLRQNI